MKILIKISNLSLISMLLSSDFLRIFPQNCQPLSWVFLIDFVKDLTKVGPKIEFPKYLVGFQVKILCFPHDSPFVSFVCSIGIFG